MTYFLKHLLLIPYFYVLFDISALLFIFLTAYVITFFLLYWSHALMWIVITDKVADI